MLHVAMTAARSASSLRESEALGSSCAAYLYVEHTIGQRRAGGCQVKCGTFLHWYPVSEQYHKLIERRFPLGYGLGPFFGDML